MPRSSGSRSRPKKRKGFFQKNNTFASKIRIREESEQSPTVDLDLDSEPPTLSQSSGVDIEKSTPSSSRSKQKLEGLYGVTNSSDESDSYLDLESYDCEDQSEAGYRIIDLDLLKSQVRLDLVCRQCHSTSELVQKRMGTRLRKLKSSYSGKKLRDGKGKQIDQIQSYFGNAIRDNKNDIRSMREAIWAVYFHKLSTNSNPRHQLCNIKWCKYKQAESNPDLLKSFKHKNSLPEPVLEIIKPVFKDLTHPDLLNKCLDSYTQNANESINQKIWKICPKNQYHGAKTVRTAVALATVTFNDVMKSFIKIFYHLQIRPGFFTYIFVTNEDKERIRKAEIRATEASLEYRRQKRREKLAADRAKEDGAYASGAHAYK